MKETLITLLEKAYLPCKEVHSFKLLKSINGDINELQFADNFEDLQNSDTLLNEISSLLNTGYTLTEETTTENTVYLLFENDSDTVELMIASEPE